MLTQDQNQTIEAEVVDQDKKQASPNGQHKKEKPVLLRVADVLDTSLGACALLFYLLFCAFYNGTAPSNLSNWAIYWTVLFLPSILTGFIRAIALHSFSRVPISQIALFAFLFPSLYTGQFHPNWVILLVIPLYYSVFIPIERLIRGRND